MLAPDECLATGELKGELPSQDWAPQGSGTLVRPENVGRLDELWSDWLDAMFGARGAERGTGNATVAKGRQLDSTQRKKIEDAAQDRLMGLYRNDGWAVCDTRHGHPYDAVANRKGSRRYLEAKGTTTPGTSVILSRNEVTHARDHPGEWVIGIWSGMRFLDDGEVDPDSGHFQVLELTPDDDDLQVIDYRWSLPAQ